MVCASKFEDENYTYIMYHVINSFLLNKKTDCCILQYVPCYVMQQINEMTGCTMKIKTPNGYLYHLELDKLEHTTLISGEHWDDLIQHYAVDYDDQIVVNLDGDKEFFRAIVIDKDRKEKQVINEPGCKIQY